MAFQRLTREGVQRAQSGPPVATQRCCRRGVAEALTAAGADVTFTGECDAEVIVPADLPPETQIELAVLARQRPLADQSARPSCGSKTALSRCSVCWTDPNSPPKNL